MTPSRRRQFGVEEEYLLLDAKTGRPTDHAAALIRSLPDHRESADREFFASQLETATPVCEDAAEAEAILTEFRAEASSAAVPLGIVMAGTGLPPVGGDEPGTVTPKERYRMIRAEARSAADHQYVTGTHVHIEVPSRDAGADVLQRLARWAPALMALTANSPIWCGEPTGFASWRYIMGLNWPISGYPPEFSNGDEYTRAVERLISTGVLIDSGAVTWLARLSHNFPTIELRIADAQLEPRDAVDFATVLRAIVDQGLRDAEAGIEPPRILPGLVNGAIWLAARNGLGSEVVYPLHGEAIPAFALLERMVDIHEATLSAFGDLDRVQGYLDRLRRQGSPAARQVAAFDRGGVPGLVDLYRSGSD